MELNKNTKSEYQAQPQNRPLTYQEAGVDVKKGENFVDHIKNLVKSVPSEQVIQGIGGFSALFHIGHGRYLVSATDGVGTKLKVAQQLNNYSTIGIDLVAMCVNDLICTGARPLFFLDYFSTGKLDLAQGEQIIKGIMEGLSQCSTPLIGGETAEMPDVYDGTDFDLAGFCVGEVWDHELITGKQISDGDAIIGIGSSGFHSNGLSLLRKVISPLDQTLYPFLLNPTKIYVNDIIHYHHNFPEQIKGLAHITGGGWKNIARISDQFNYHISKIPQEEELPSMKMDQIIRLTNLPDQELFTTFNMGIGMCMIVAPKNVKKVIAYLKDRGHKAFQLGHVCSGEGKVLLAQGYLSSNSFELK